MLMDCDFEVQMLQAGTTRHTEDAQGHDVILFQGPWKPKGNRWWLEVWNPGQWWLDNQDFQDDSPDFGYVDV